MKKLLGSLGTSAILLMASSPLSSIDMDKKEYIADSKHEEVSTWEENYNKIINYIKEHEGFNDGYKYIDLAGHATIGYGHVIWPDEEFPDRISEETADSLLRADFQKALDATERLTNLEDGPKKLAIAHFIYAKGVGNFAGSDLRKLVNQGKPIDEEIQKWIYYTNTNGKLVKSDYSHKIRLWELEMYNSAN